MKRGVLESWIREFCSLVFIQSIQAFIFTIIIALIVAVGSANNGNQDSKNLAFGVVAIVGLASISKMEELTKKIFGIGPNLTDPSMRGGVKSWMTMMAAGKLAKNVLDNPKKIAAGVKGSLTANKEKMDALNARKKAMDKLNKRVTRDFGSPIAASGLEQIAQSSGEQGAAESSENVNLPNNVNDTAASVETTSSDVSPSAKDENTAAVSNLGEPTGFSSRSISDSNKLYDKYQDQADEIEKNYKDKIKEIEKKQKESWKTSASGITETLGALMGGTAGIIKGMSEGDIKGMIDGAGFGMGIGDAIGAKAVDLPVNLTKTVVAAVKSNDLMYGIELKKKKNEFAKQKKMIDEALNSLKTDVSNVE